MDTIHGECNDTSDHAKKNLTTETEPAESSPPCENTSGPIDQPPPPLQTIIYLPTSTTPNPLSNHRPVEDGGKDEQISYLELELAKAQSMIECLQEAERERAKKEGTHDMTGTSASGKDSEDTSSLLMELQSNLQQQMSLKAEAENRARLAETKLQQLQSTLAQHAEEALKMHDWQENLQQQMLAKAEAENKARVANERLSQVEGQLAQQTELVQEMQQQLDQMRQEMTAQEMELQKIRQQRDEQERREMALTNRLNAAKKKEADQGNLAQTYEDDLKNLENEVHTTQQELAKVTAEKAALQKELQTVQSTLNARLHRAETLLAEERDLNEERKRKMKAFVESKSEELRQAKADHESLQVELNQTNRTLMDLNNRWKQLHAQYVQSQTRNRELQRDLNRIKKDSETLHKVGDTLEMKLSRSATETEEHKSKRLAAKHELMSVLRTLEAEQEVTATLRDSIKFSFTPKALSQQQLLRESLVDFEAQLQKLSRRLGKPLPPPTTEPYMNDQHPDYLAEEDGSKNHNNNENISRLISKLERETQGVSQCIMALTSNVERMHSVLDASGERNCYTALSELVINATANNQASSAYPGGHAQHHNSGVTHVSNGNDDSSSSRPMASIRSSSHRYGQIPSSMN